MKGKVWRYIEEDGVSASFGLAGDEYLMQTAAVGGPPTLRLYTYRSHAALVGQFQNVEAEVRVDECRRRGIAINRRPTGGGSVIMGEEQLGVALVASTHGVQYQKCHAAIFEACSDGLLAGLRWLGIHAGFRPKNDIEVGGKKIAGLALSIDERESFLCHASLLVDFDVSLMLAVLNLPREKIAGKAIASFEERLTTVRRELESPVSTSEVRAHVRSGFAEALAARFEPKSWTEEEHAAISALESRKYSTPEWVFEHVPTPDAVGTSLLKTSAGLLRVYVALGGEVLKNVMVTGDFFATTRALTNLEARVKWTHATPEGIAKTIRAVFAADGPPIIGLSADALTEAISTAVVAARGNAG
ncbi:MAG: biotin/lipoate A/B protein ligase family protein [Candidatus Methylomirabilales bacterium]